MSIELIIIICIVSTVAGTISAGIRYYGSKQKAKSNKDKIGNKETKGD